MTTLGKFDKPLHTSDTVDEILEGLIRQKCEPLLMRLGGSIWVERLPYGTEVAWRQSRYDFFTVVVLLDQDVVNHGYVDSVQSITEELTLKIAQQPRVRQHWLGDVVAASIYYGVISLISPWILWDKIVAVRRRRQR